MSPTDRPADATAALRREVGELRRRERRRRFPLSVHAGRLGGGRVGTEVGWPEPAGFDPALRFDVVDALLTLVSDTLAAGRTDVVDIWLARPGVPVTHDLDLAWHAAARHAAGAHGRPLAGFHVVTRTGWLDVVTGECRTWKRLRL